MITNLPKKSLNFIEQIVEDDLENKKHKKIITRFPPEPNGYLHIGHAKSIYLNFGLAENYNGACHLRFDDTNPATEEEEYVKAIKEDIRWLGFDWREHEYFTSDYFPLLYDLALKLVNKGLAYVDDLSAEEFNVLKGIPTHPGTPSPFRNRSVEDNLKLFDEMRRGKYREGEKVLRAKIDLSSPNMHMRDPIMFRIKHTPHHRTGNKWCIFPSYDFAHGQSDSIEKITHSICTLEFEEHRPLYNWFIENLEIYPSKQTEFARLNLSYTLTSKRNLKQLVEEKYVDGWDDPRMPTISGVRRRGFTPNAIKKFIALSGVAKRNGITDVAVLEHTVREDLNKICNRVFGVLSPIELIITNWPEDQREPITAVNNPEDESAGKRTLVFEKKLYIDSSDFMENPPSPRKWYRLGPNRVVRLKYGYIIKCSHFEKDEDGNIRVYASYYPNSKSGQDTSGIKAKGTLSWVGSSNYIKVQVNQYDRLFLRENMNEFKGEFLNYLNPNSVIIIKNVLVEKSIQNAQVGDRFQFERVGYFRVDESSTKDDIILNQTISLKENWSKQQ